MKRRILLFSTLLVLPFGALAGDVIASGDITLTPDEIRDVFLGERRRAGGIVLVPVDNAAAQEEFLSKVLQTDAQKYYSRWTKKSFREGIVAPALKGSDAEVIAFVRSTQGAVGYVKRSVPGFRILHSF